MDIAILERAQFMRLRLGTEAAALWMEKQGMSFEIAVVALVGSGRARHYGVEMGRIAQRGWNK